MTFVLTNGGHNAGILSGAGTRAIGTSGSSRHRHDEDRYIDPETRGCDQTRHERGILVAGVDHAGSKSRSGPPSALPTMGARTPMAWHHSCRCAGNVRPAETSENRVRVLGRCTFKGGHRCTNAR